jgi:hypothetical protein
MRASDDVRPPRSRPKHGSGIKFAQLRRAAKGFCAWHFREGGVAMNSNSEADSVPFFDYVPAAEASTAPDEWDDGGEDGELMHREQEEWEAELEEVYDERWDEVFDEREEVIDYDEEEPEYQQQGDRYPYDDYEEEDEL